jgi:putative ATP-dependent endonuclease of OLD family
MIIRQFTITRFRGIDSLTVCPGSRALFLGPNNAGKSTILEALDLALHSGLGRPRAAPDELDYYARDPEQGFEIEVVLANLGEQFTAEAGDHLEGWDPDARAVVPDPDASGVEPAVRVRVVGSPDLDLSHEFAKPESAGARFGPRLRRQVGWLFDGRTRDPAWQMTFHRGGVLDRLFADHDLDPALDHVRDALRDGADGFSGDAAVLSILGQVARDLDALGLGDGGGLPGFELGAVSARELLQTLRLALPVLPELLIPLRRQGRGVQRLLLVASLLRLASGEDHTAPIAAFEEPEEALEPLRQTQIAELIRNVADQGGQILVVTHSVEIARSFPVEDIHLVSEAPRGSTTSLRDHLSARSMQGYERRLDGAVARALFARIPVLVEGPGDRALFGVFWDALVNENKVRARHVHAMDFINCEGESLQPEMARVLCEAGKRVVAWVEADVPKNAQTLRDESQCHALVLYPSGEDRHNLEAAVSHVTGLPALAAGMEVIASGRGYTWDEQRDDLLSRLVGASPAERDAAKATSSVSDFLAALPDPVARTVARNALSSTKPTPFEIKGARPARLLAEKIVELSGVPSLFSSAMVELEVWMSDKNPKPHTEIVMK